MDLLCCLNKFLNLNMAADFYEIFFFKRRFNYSFHMDGKRDDPFCSGENSNGLKKS